MKESIVILALTFLFSLNAKAELSTYTCSVIRKMDQAIFLKKTIIKNQVLWQTLWGNNTVDTITVGIINKERFLEIHMMHMNTGRTIIDSKITLNEGDERTNPELIEVDSTNSDYTQWTVRCERGTEE